MLLAGQLASHAQPIDIYGLKNGPVGEIIQLFQAKRVDSKTEGRGFESPNSCQAFSIAWTMFRVERFLAIGGFVGNFCPGFLRLPLHKWRCCHAGVPAQVMRVKDCPHILQAMPGKGGNLSLTTSAKRKSGHGSSAKVVGCQPGHFRLGDNPTL